MSDPQTCVCAGTCSNPPNAVEQARCKEKEKAPPHLDKKHDSSLSTLDPHYVFRRTDSIVPPDHPNAGIGGYSDFSRSSDIGGYYNIDRESEIGNDHDFNIVYKNPRRETYVYKLENTEKRRN
ncbi:hypothetical protein LPJ73_004764 [Coemansia sp. RSA 2703]|nr:hypothetical protein LPJ73_004764 [Coemansia sp. RSA 2703]